MFYLGYHYWMLGDIQFQKEFLLQSYEHVYLSLNRNAIMFSETEALITNFSSK